MELTVSVLAIDNSALTKYNFASIFRYLIPSKYTFYIILYIISCIVATHYDVPFSEPIVFCGLTWGLGALLW